jgi:hypothetical protein
LPIFESSSSDGQFSAFYRHDRGATSSSNSDAARGASVPVVVSSTGRPTGTEGTSSLTLSAGNSAADLSAPERAAVLHATPFSGTTTSAQTAQTLTAAAAPSSLSAPPAGTTSDRAANMFPVAAPAPQLSPVTVLPTAASINLQPLTNIKLTRIESTGDPGPQITDVASSFFGTAGVANLNKDVYVASSNTLIAAGSATDPTSSVTTDAVVTSINATLTSAVRLFLNFGAGSTAEALTVDADASGVVYTAGDFTNSNGVRNLFVARINSALNHVDWSVTGPHPADQTAVGGIKLDATGTNLYGVGDYSLVNRNRQAQNLLAFKGTNLGAATPTIAYARVFPMLDSNGNPANAIGTGAGVDATGQLDFSGIFGVVNADGTHDKRPMEGRVNPTGTSVSAATFLSNGELGGMASVFTDSAGNYYLTGTNYTTTDPFSFLLITKFSSTGMQIYGVNWFLTNGSGQHVFNWIGMDVKALANGNAAMSTTDDDGSGANGTVGQILFIVGPTGGTLVDFGDGGAFGSNNDYGQGLALDPSNNLYGVGATNSPDFHTTAGVFQPTFTGLIDGWVGRFTSP